VDEGQRDVYVCMYDGTYHLVKGLVAGEDLDGSCRAGVGGVNLVRFNLNAIP